MNMYKSKIELPIEILEIAYWVHPVGESLKMTEIVIDGYNVRVDADGENFLVVVFRDTRNDKKYTYKWSDIKVVPNRAAAKALIQAIENSRIAYPISRPQYEEV